MKKYGLILCAVAFLALPATSAQAQQFLEMFGNISQQGVKLCSAVVPGNWRNDLMVPKSWNATACTGWAQAINAQRGDKGCLGPSGVHYEFQQNPNWNTCGW
jgi:hypothetical protein